MSDFSAKLEAPVSLYFRDDALAAIREDKELFVVELKNEFESNHITMSQLIPAEEDLTVFPTYDISNTILNDLFPDINFIGRLTPNVLLITENSEKILYIIDRSEVYTMKEAAGLLEERRTHLYCTIMLAYNKDEILIKEFLDDKLSIDEFIEYT